MLRLPFNMPEDAFVIAADAGLELCRRSGVIPDVVVGDFDSVAKAPDKTCGYEIITALPEKDDTDTMLAVKSGFERGFTDFMLTGVTGGRAGHTAAAIGTLEYIIDHGGQGYIEDERSRFYIQGQGSREYNNDNDYEYVSVFTLSGTSRVNLRRLKYEAEELTISRAFPVGVSNEFVCGSCTIEVTEGKILVILEKREPNAVHMNNMLI